MKKHAAKIFFLLTIIIIIFILKDGLNKWPFTRMCGDFTAYWSSARLLIDGQNPYQADKIFALQNAVGYINKSPIVSYSPPWAITFIIPFAFITYPLAKFIWFLFILTCTLVSSTWLWQLYGGTDKNRIWLLPSLFVFSPLYYALGWGQITPVMLLGLVAFLHFIKKENWFFAGVFTCLPGVKPQDSYLFFIALLLWIIAKRRWGVIFGAIVTASIIVAIPLLFNPHIFLQYYNEILSHSFHYHWRTPTLSYWLRHIFGYDKEFLHYIPLLVGITWLFYHWHRNRKAWIWAEQMPIIIFASLITTIYVWTYNFVLLLIAVIPASIWVINNNLRSSAQLTIILIYLLINLLAWISTFTLSGLEWDVWIPPALLVTYMSARYFLSDHKI